MSRSVTAPQPHLRVIGLRPRVVGVDAADEGICPSGSWPERRREPPFPQYPFPHHLSYLLIAVAE